MTTTEPDRSSSPGGSSSSSAPKSPKGHRIRARALRLGLEWLVVIAVALLAALAIKTWLIQAFYIPSGSMEPTLKVGDRILVDKLSYQLHPIHRGDMIVFRTPPNDRGDPNIKDLVKRVVGVPGDKISSAGGHVLIDGRILTEPYLPTGTVTDGISPQVIPRGHYFVMGDNRGDSLDSRHFGTIDGSLVVGRVVMRIWPVTSISLF